MHFSLAFLPLLGLSLQVNAQALNATGLVSALQAAGLTSLASAAIRANETKEGQELLNALVNGTQNYTVFAPNNAAFDAPAVNAVKDNAERLAAILSYHVLPGNFVNASKSPSELDSATFPYVTVGRTLLTNSTLVDLEGNKGQVLVWTRNDTSNSSIYFLNQDPEVTVLSSTLVGKIFVSTISGVLVAPGPLDEVIKAANLTRLAGIVDMVKVPDFFRNGTNATIAQALQADSTHGFTLFAPDDAALQAAGTALTSLVANQTALLALLGNHYINGTSYYSPNLVGSSSSDQFVSASGQTFTVSTNSSGTYVSSGSASAKIIKSDVLVENGVIHVVDRVLVNLDRDESKASSAYQSATSVAAQLTTETGPVGPTGTGTSAGGGGAGTSSSGSGSNGLMGWATVLGMFGWTMAVGYVVTCMVG